MSHEPAEQAHNGVPKLLPLAVLVCLTTAGCSCGSTALDTASHHDDAGGGGRSPDGGRVDGASSVDAKPDVYTEGLGVQSHSGSQVSVIGFRSGDAVTNGANPELRDTKHGVVCQVHAASDGKMRCLPDRDVIVFADDACTIPIAVDRSGACGGGAAPLEYAVEYWGGDTLCKRSRPSVYKVGAVRKPPAYIYERNIFGCVPHGGSVTTVREATPVPLDDWIEFEHETIEVTDRLGVSSWRGKDGSLWVQSLALLPEGTPCEGATQGGSTPRCIPSDRLVRSDNGGLFADDACTQPVGGRCEPSPALIEDYSAGAFLPSMGPCAARLFPEVGPLFHVSKEVDHADVHWGVADNMCEPAPDSQLIGAFLYYSGSEPARFDDYPVVGQTLSGTDRLQQVFYVAEDGSKLTQAPSVFFDAVAQAYCHPRDLLADGTIVCAPDDAVVPGGFGTNLFSDSGCTKGVVDMASCRSPVAVLLSKAEPGPKGETYACVGSLNRISAYAGSVFQSLGPDPALPCLAVDPRGFENQTFYEIAEPVDPTALFPALDAIDL